ncbi:hypothetical protein [Thiobacillus sp.]|jgi:hypothetical protein|uniref:hypothetical protein n=1 Tax=Thiobacillus sp. TaxID=924 RepID=UPI00086A4D57|nr:hypothetical protein [Thiobacillus sp.]MBC2729296.1 hypothetical protein [Thiobacillus sp.]MBC2738031.1 hypothetical protein [Thiobacillus sp.]MBC2759624.1 hypothetical protein [Thiobacillus sp.]ODU45550.1 MAG: hypothetical protein ABS92_09400 [Thiobacillus sp. SCN 63-374]
MPICHTVKPSVRVLAVALVLCAAPLNTYAESRSEWLFFPAVTAVHRTGLPQGDELERNHIEPVLDVLGTGGLSSMTWLAEIFVSEHEQELARLNVGWRLNPQNTLSIGKFHNLQGYWNTQFNHGAYLQTAIDKPGVVDDSAPLPLHYVGAQMEGKLVQWGEGLLNYSLGIGKGAVMKNGLVSPDIVGAGKLGDLSLGLRLSYTPDETSPTQAGVFFARNKIPVENSNWTGITQDVGGLFANWESDPFRVIAELYVFSNKLEGSGAMASGNFLYGYVQGEYRFSPRSTALIRMEETGGTNNDPLLALIPDFELNKQLIGLRYDVTWNQAVKIEASHVERLDTSYRQVQIQWSAVFP